MNNIQHQKLIIAKLRDTITELMICPAFNATVFELQPEAHKAWQRARDVLKDTAHLVKYVDS